MERIRMEIMYDGANGEKSIKAYGKDIFECLEDMLSEIRDYEDEYKGNNVDGNNKRTYTEDEHNLYNNELKSIANDIWSILEN